jgi:HKD family nuclease
LASLENTEVKFHIIQEMKGYMLKHLFQRNTGFHTGYIGSSFSRSALTDGLEWNLKSQTKEVSHIIDKFKRPLKRIGKIQNLNYLI